MNKRIAVNIGNSRTNCGLFQDGKLAESWYYATSNLAHFAPVLAQKALQDPEIKLATCSVVPSANEILQKCLRKHGLESQEVKYESQEIIYEAYAGIGADRIASAAAALRRYGSKDTILVFDFGTATTLTVIDNTGRFLGGLISLGLGKSFDALHQFTAQLPDLKQSLGSVMDEGLGKNTSNSIIAGCVLGHVGLLEYWVQRSKVHFSQDAKIVATGGYARYLIEHTAEIDVVDPNLTLIGINLIAEETSLARR